MPLKVVVKVGSVNNLSDARYCAGMGVDMIGFDFSESSVNCVTKEKFQEISEWLSGVEFVAEFSQSSIKEIEEILESCDVSFIQVDDQNLIKDLSHLNKKIILAQSLEQLTTLAHDLPITYLVLQGDEEMINEHYTENLNTFNNLYDILLGIGISADNAETIVKKTNAQGINLKGGHEIRPGFKDYDDLANILEALELDD